MKEFDYIIVGQGIAGTVLAFQLRLKGKHVFVIDKNRDFTSSKIAPGTYNPMVLKRFTPCWKVEDQLTPLYDFLDAFETSFNTSIHVPLKLWRRFASIQEQNLWLEKSDHHRLVPFMKPSFISNPHKDINADFGFGEVKKSGWVDFLKLISIFKHRLISEGCFLDEEFDYNSMLIGKNTISYKSISAQKIVFCEGHRLTNNPFFNYLPLMRTKGELITVKLEGLNVQELIKSNITLLPLGDDVYKVGATFNWDDKDEICSVKAREELLAKLKELVNKNPVVINQYAGLRPTVKDRRALLGAHPNHDNIIVFNGLGTRGLLISPYLAIQLIEFMEKGVALDPEVDIKRYKNDMPC
ncbi:MAG: FAD-dependent oxidoreductase [Bacteroidetes bacterium MED-G21]|nr:MAG: FAD-dependent oxidoreductase [Bacteroidetes bacterium MED-G21]